jgi:hypothetical protein
MCDRLAAPVREVMSVKGRKRRRRRQRKMRMRGWKT